MGERKNVLESVASAKLVGLLHQIGELSEFAQHIFETIFKETQLTGRRINGLGSRIQRVEQNMPKFEEIFMNKDPSYFYARDPTTASWKRNDRARLTCNLITAKSQSKPLENLRNKANPPPNLDELNPYRKEGDTVTCLHKYSNPGF